MISATAGLLLMLVALPADVTGTPLRRTPTVELVDRVRPAIVNIQGEKTASSPDGYAGQTEPYRRVNGMGTGVIVDERGYILTNMHVVDGVRQINVTLADKKTYVARVVSRDYSTDLAIIKIKPARELTVIDIGTSRDLMLGEPVVAIGNAYGYEHTVTRGIISALHRSVQVSDAQGYDDLIQTDASINPGNSGGPLLNVDGEMIGIVVAVRAGAQGIGFAIPVDKAMAVAAELLSPRRVNQVWHGVSARSRSATSGSGFVVQRIEKDSPGEQAGLRAGDIIHRAAATDLAGSLDFQRAFLSHSAGDTVKLSIERDGQQLSVSMLLTAAPSDEIWQRLGLKLKSIPTKQFQRYRTKYRGGLTVSDVRPDSPASSQGIRSGDILVGMHVWETVSLDNVSYVLNRPDFEKLDPLKFYILRGNETLYGHMKVANRRKR